MVFNFVRNNDSIIKNSRMHLKFVKKVLTEFYKDGMIVIEKYIILAG